jgi:hypothetical protein
MNAEFSIRIVLYLLGGFFLGIYSFIDGLALWKRLNIIKNTPTSKIRSLALGRVEISGNIELFQNHCLTGPFSNFPCVYLRCTIEEESGSGEDRSWTTLSSFVSGVLFYLKDETGHVLCDVRGGKVDLGFAPAYSLVLNSRQEIPSNISQVLANLNIKVGKKNIFGFRNKLRFREYMIVPGQYLYILATATENPYLNNSHLQNIDGSDRILVCKTDNVFKVSTKPESKLVKSKTFEVIVKIVVGICFILVSLFFTISYIKSFL